MSEHITSKYTDDQHGSDGNKHHGHDHHDCGLSDDREEHDDHPHGQDILVITVNNKSVRIEGPQGDGAADQAGCDRAGRRHPRRLRARRDSSERRGAKSLVTTTQSRSTNKKSKFVAQAADDNSCSRRPT